MFASGDDLTASDDASRKMMRQIAGDLVGKLKGARDRIRKERGKCEGRKAHREVNPTAVALVKRLHRASPKTGKRMSLRRINAALEAAGHVNEHGRPFNPKSIKSMVERKPARHAPRCQ